MKTLIYVLYGCFTLLMIVTFYMAHKVHDGYVEEHYYEKARDFFSVKEREEQLGFRALLKQDLTVGVNDFTMELTQENSPMSDAQITLFIGNIATTRYDKRYRLAERSPGSYETTIDIPEKGQWMIKVDISHKNITTERRWNMHIE